MCALFYGTDRRLRTVSKHFLLAQWNHRRDYKSTVIIFHSNPADRLNSEEHLGTGLDFR